MKPVVATETKSALTTNLKIGIIRNMLRFSPFIVLLFLTGTVLAQNAPTDTSACFYLLKTGFLLEGTATNNGKHYVLKTDFGSMSVPVQNVEYVGRTKQDVYSYKKAFVNQANCNAVMRFAEWCVNNGLQNEGIAEYRLALQVAPNAALTDIIRNRLQVLTEPPAQPQFDVPSVNAAQVDAPYELVSAFARRVQPVLVARCASADCHGTNGTQKFKIAIPAESMGRTTYQNYQAVLPFLNLDYPRESPLLSSMIASHGGAKKLLSVESNQYTSTLQWVQLLAKELPIEEQKDTAKPMIAADKKPIKTAMLPTVLRNAIPPQTSNLNSSPADNAPQVPKPDSLSPDTFNQRYH